MSARQKEKVHGPAHKAFITTWKKEEGETNTLHASKITSSQPTYSNGWVKETNERTEEKKTRRSQ